MKYALLILLTASACTSDVDPPWQLDHDRIIAVRATPPRIPAGATAQLDLLVGHKGAPTSVQPPDATRVVSPMSLAGAVTGATVTAPGEDQLAAARAELQLDPGAPVPLVIGVGVAADVSAGGLAATKTVFLGDTADNPALEDVMLDGQPAPPPGTMLTVGKDVDVPLAVTADDSVDIVNWLTSCGTMHDFDLHLAHIHVLPKDPQTGELALVLRMPDGGVAWATWPISAE